MPETVEQIIIDLEGRDKASKPIDQVLKRSEALVKTVRSLHAATNRLIDTFEIEAKVLKSSSKAVGAAVQAEEQLAKAKRNTVTATQDSIKAQREAAENARRFGDVESRGTAILGAAGFIGGGAGQKIEQTGRIGTELLAATEGVGLLKQELPELARQLGITKSSAAVLGVEMAALAGAFLIIKSLAGEIADQAEGTKIAVGGQIDALKEYNDLIQTATTDDVQARLVELAQTREAKGKLLEDLYAIKLAVDEGLDAGGPGAERLAGNLLKIGDALGVVDFGVDDLNDAIAATEKELTGGNRLFNLLVQALNDGTIATNDATQREREYTQAKIEGLEREARIQTEAANLTEDAVDKRIDAINAETVAREKELTALRGLEQNDQVIAQIETVNDRLSELSEEARLLDSVARPLAQANDAVAEAEKAAAEQAKGLAKAIDTAQKVYQSAAAQQVKAADDLAKAVQKRQDFEEDYARESVEIEQDRDLKLIQEAEKFALKRVNDLADHYKELADLDRQFYEERGELLEDLQRDLNDLDIGLGEDLAGLKDDLKDDLTDLTQDRLDALKDYNTDAARAAEDHYKRLQQIQRSAQNDIRSASARLDALGIYEAQKNAEEQLDIETDRYTTEQKRREEDFRDQLRDFQRQRRQRLQEYRQAEQDLRKRYQRERQERIQAYRRDLQDLTRQHQRERQATIAAFQEELRREDQQRALERQHQQQAWAIEDQRRANQYQRERDQLGQHYSALLTATSNGLYQVELAYQAWLDSMAARTSSSAVGVSAAGGIPGGPYPTYAHGGYPPINRPVIVGERGPELVRFRQPARVYASGQRPSPLEGATINIYVDGSRSPMQTAYVTERKLQALLRSER